MERLIDANEILKSKHQHYNPMADEYYVPVSDIENAPTVDAELVEHGEWIPKITELGTMVFECSACHRFIDIHWAYCPQCGAKMDGGRREDADQHRRNYHQ